MVQWEDYLLPARMSTHSLLLSRNAWGGFLPWYLVRMPAAIVRGYGKYAAAFARIFSFVFLLKTLFSPWKSIGDRYPTKGFNLSEIAQVFALNMPARLIGAFIRLIVILLGVALEALLLVAAVVFLLLWVLFPLLVVGLQAWILPSLF